MKNKKIMSTILILTSLFISISLVSSQQTGNYASCPGAMMYGGYGSGAMIFSWAFGLLILIALILLIFWLIKQIQKK